MVLPMQRAPADSSACTAAAERSATVAAAAQSGVPPPVTLPSRSNMSLTARRSPASGPPGAPFRTVRGPGTKAPASADTSCGKGSAAARPTRQPACAASSAVITSPESQTKPKHFLTFQIVASVQKSGEVVAQQSETMMQP